MSSLPATRPGSQIALLPRVTVADLYDALLTDSRCSNTQSARLHDMRVFASFLRLPDGRTAAAFLASQGRGQANAVAMAFRQHEMERGGSPATVNRRLATLRRTIALARRLGILEWSLDVDDLRLSVVRDTRGPDLDSWRQLWEFIVASGDTPRARRDRALIRLIHDSALRKFEAIGVDVEDLDLAGARVQILAKGSGRSKSWIALSAPCVRLIGEWLEARGQESGPLFVSHPRIDAAAAARFTACVAERRGAGQTWGDIAKALNAARLKTAKGLKWTAVRAEQHFAALQNLAPHTRMCEREVNRILKRISAECGFARDVRPHGLRHCAITRALDLNNGDVRKVQRFARHSKPETTIRYDDNRRDLAGDVTRQLGDDV